MREEPRDNLERSRQVRGAERKPVLLESRGRGKEDLGARRAWRGLRRPGEGFACDQDHVLGK